MFRWSFVVSLMRMSLNTILRGRGCKANLINQHNHGLCISITTGITTLLLASGFASAQQEQSSQSARSSTVAPFAPRLNPIVVTGTLVEQSSFMLPMSIDVVESSVIQEAQPRVNLTEALSRVPGLVI